MDSATVRGMTKFGFRSYSGNDKAVMLREVAVSMVDRKGRWILWLMRWQGEMDSATAHGMTRFGFDGYSGNDEAVMLREVAVSMVDRKGRWILWLMRWRAGDGFRDCARNDEDWQRVTDCTSL